MHFCGDMLRKAALTDVSQACPMHNAVVEIPKECCITKSASKTEKASCHPVAEKEDCCSTAQLSMDLDIDAIQSQLSPSPQLTAIKFCLANENVDFSASSYVYHRIVPDEVPPDDFRHSSFFLFQNHGKHIPILVQSFLL